MQSRRIWPARSVLALLLALLATALSAPAALADADIASAGPLTHIYISNDLRCQVQYAGDQFYSFYPPTDTRGDCGTFLRNPPSAATASLTFIEQSPVTGSGTRADPYEVVTRVGTGTALELTRTDSYVVGDDYYRSDVTATNTGDADESALLWQGADCFLQDTDSGYGYYDSATGGIYCSANAHNSPPARLEGFVPLSPGSTYYEGEFPAAFDPGPDGFPNSCQCTELVDNGMGLAWTINLGPFGSTTRSFLTTFSPTGQAFGNQPQEQPQQQPSSSGPVAAAQVPPRTVDDLPVPQLGVSVNVQELSGQVFVGVPGVAARTKGARASQKGITFVPLSEARQIPVGSFLDTRKGKLRLQSARDRRGTRQNGDFSQGLFQVLQSRRSRGLTDVVLKGASFSSCRRGGRGKGARSSQSRIIRRLRSNARGRFRTRGRHSAATVRGTAWLTADRCDGTLTRVTRGRVAVRDFRRRKTVVVRAGKSYLARARR